MKPGLYDNRRTMARECWVVDIASPMFALMRRGTSIAAATIETKPAYGGLAGLVAPWGSYPDVTVDDQQGQS